MMSKFYILSDDGVLLPVSSVIEWARWFETHDRRIAYDKLPTCCISTIFLGLDHGWGEGPPVLWETLVIGGRHDGEQLRYTSEKEALECHRLLVERCRKEG